MKVSSLPRSKAGDLLMEAEKRALKILPEEITFTSEMVWIFGLADIIQEIRAKQDMEITK